MLYRCIKLTNGGELELEMTQEFIDRVRQQFLIEDNNPVTDEHLRMFVYGATKSAVDKAEREMSHGERT